MIIRGNIKLRKNMGYLRSGGDLRCGETVNQRRGFIRDGEWESRR